MRSGDAQLVFGPTSCKPHIPDPVTHRAVVPPDDGGPITFHWHFQRGMLSPRMSALELAVFVLEHMGAILSMGLLSGHPRVIREFQAIMVILATSKKEAIDRLLPWIRSVTRKGPDDVIKMELYSQEPQASGPLWFVPEIAC